MELSNFSGVSGHDLPENGIHLCSALILCGLCRILAKPVFFGEFNFFSNILWKMDFLNVLERKQ
ncbi:MAG: hypothetical protein JWO28_1086 [Hyphomicrobiales bacterium]|jgi:hypothetical protein|nr:hypothetical protein [Hyphomicrobiales bacterium]